MMKKVLAVIMTAALLLVLLAIPASAAGVKFDDVSESRYYYGAISRWSEAGVVKGYGDGTFRPNAPIARNEFATILCKAFGAPTDISLNPFTDVDEKKWDAPYVLGAYAAGWMNGKTADYFDRKGGVTREEAFAVFARAMGIAPLTNEKEIAEILGEYTDGDRVHSWARGYTAAIIKEGLVAGTSTTAKVIGPRDVLTRGQLVKLLDNITGNDYNAASGDYTDKGFYITEGTDGKDVSEEGYVIVNTPEGVTLNGANGRVAVAPGSSGTAAAEGGPLNIEDAEISNLFVNASNYVVEVNDGLVEEIVVPASASNVTIKVNDGASVGKIVADGNNVKVEGTGEVGKVEANGKGADVQTPGTEVTAGAKSGGATAGDSQVRPGETKTVAFDGEDDQGMTPAPYGKVRVTFDKNYDGAKSSNVVVDKDTAVTKPADPTRAGFVFEGWFVNKEHLLGEKAFDFTSKISENTVLYAHWEEEVLEDVIFVDGVTNKEISAIQVVVGKTIPAEEIPSTEKEGYEFDGWYIGEEKIDDISEYIVEVTGSTGTVITAKWNIITYNVMFDRNNGTANVNMETVDYGTTVTKPEDPEYEGHTFLGWFDGDKAYDFTKPVTSDLSLKAKWEINKYSVTFDYDNGAGLGHATVEHGKTVAEPTDVERTGYTFKGWFDGDKAYDFSKAVTGNLNLKAKWEINKYNVTFDYDNGAGLGHATVEHGKTVEEPDVDEREGYIFKGWYNGAVKYDFTKPVTSDLNLKAKWDVITFKVTFNANGGTSVASKTVEYGKTVEVPTEPTKKGNTFQYWALGEDEYDFASPVYEDLTLSAVWEKDLYTVTFNLNGGNIDGIETSIEEYAEYNETVELPESPVIEGGVFTGWFTAANKGFSSATKVTEDVEVFARYKMNTYKVTFDSNGGSAVATQTVEHGNTAVEPTRPTLKNNALVAWLDEDGEEFDFATPITEDITLTAYWIPVAPQAVTYLNVAGLTYNTGVQQAFIVTTGDEITLLDETKVGITPETKALKGWSVVQGTGDAVEYLPGETVRIMDHTNITPILADKLTVQFWNGAAGTASKMLAEVTVAKGNTVDPIADPVRPGYEFLYWNAVTVSNGVVTVVEEDYDFDKPVTGGLLLQAAWSSDSILLITEEDDSVVEYTLDNSFLAELQPGKSTSATVDFDAISNATAYPANQADTLEYYTDLFFMAPDEEGLTVNGFSASVEYGAAGTNFEYADKTLDKTYFGVNNDMEVEGARISIDYKNGKVKIGGAANGEAITANQTDLSAPVFIKIVWNYANNDVSETYTVRLSHPYANMAQVAVNRAGGKFVDENGNELSVPSYFWMKKDTYEIPDNIVRDGFEFGGWKMTKGIGGANLGDEVQPVDENTFSIQENVTLTAKWLNEVKISFHGEGLANAALGSVVLPNTVTLEGEMEDVELVETNEYILPDCGYDAGEDYTFIGWWVGANRINDVDTGSKLMQPGETLVMGAADVRIDALWSNQYYVTLKANGGVGADVVSDPIKKGESYTLPANTFEREGYEFMGWSDLASGIDNGEHKLILDEAKLQAVSASKTLYAVWRPIITVESFGQGEPVVPSSIITYTTDVSFSETASAGDPIYVVTAESAIPSDGSNHNYVAFTLSFPEDALIAGSTQGIANDRGVKGQATYYYNTKLLLEDGAKKVKDEVITWANGTTSSFKLDLADLPEMNGYSVKFDGGFPATGVMVEGKMDAEPVLAGETYTLPTADEVEFEAEGYRFKGWKVGEADYSAATKDIKITGDVILTAVWDKLYTITLDGNGGKTEDGEAQVKLAEGITNEKYTLPTAVEQPFEKTGYTFAGWKWTGNLDAAFTPGETYPIGGDATFKAQWTPNGMFVNSDTSAGVLADDRDLIEVEVDSDDGKTFYLTSEEIVPISAVKDSTVTGHFVAVNAILPGNDMITTAAVTVSESETAVSTTKKNDDGTYTLLLNLDLVQSLNKNQYFKVKLNGDNNMVYNLDVSGLKLGYRVILDANGGTGETVKSDAVTANSIVDLDDLFFYFEKENAILVGFNTEETPTTATPGTAYDLDDWVLVGKADVTLYAQYKDVFTVTYLAGGATEGTLPEKSIADDDGFVTLAEPTDVVAPEGKEFAGWKVTNASQTLKKETINGFVEVDAENDILPAKTKLQIASNIDVTAQWKIIPTVTYKAGKATEGTVPEKSIADEDGYVTLAAPNKVVAPEGMEFDGWSVTYPDPTAAPTPDTRAKVVTIDGEKVVAAAAKLPAGTKLHIFAATEVTAQWNVIPTLTYKAGEASEGTLPVAEVVDGYVTLASADTLVAPTGKEFAGWKIEPVTAEPASGSAKVVGIDGEKDVDTTAYPAGTKLHITGTVKATAQWAQLYTVKLHYNSPIAGAEDKTVVLAEGVVGKAYTIANELPEGWTAPEGYVFDYISVKSGDEFVKLQVFDQEINPTYLEFRIEWKKLPTLTYKAGEASEGTLPVAEVVDGYVTLAKPETLVAPEGKAFAGWKILDDAADTCNNAKLVTLDGVVEIVTTDSKNIFPAGTKLHLTGAVVATAQWAQLYTVTLAYNDPADPTATSNDFELFTGFEGDAYTLDLVNMPTRWTAPTGYKFAGWVQADGTTEVITSNRTLDPAKLLFKAKWTKLPVATFGYFDGGASWDYFVPMQKVVADENGLITAPDISEYEVPADLRFDGWISDHDVVVENAVGDPITIAATKTITAESFKISADARLYAKFSDLYTVTLNANFGDTPATETLEKMYAEGEVVDLSAIENPFGDREGYTFKGWGTGATAAASASYETKTAPMIFYAVWEAEQYTLTYDPDGGVFDPADTALTATLNYDAKHTLRGAASGSVKVSKDGFVLVGWSVNDSEDLLAPGTEITIKGDTTIKAVWKDYHGALDVAQLLSGGLDTDDLVEDYTLTEKNPVQVEGQSEFVEIKNGSKIGTPNESGVIEVWLNGKNMVPHTNTAYKPLQGETKTYTVGMQITPPAGLDIDGFAVTATAPTTDGIEKTVLDANGNANYYFHFTYAQIAAAVAGTTPLTDGNISVQWYKGNTTVGAPVTYKVHFNLTALPDKYTFNITIGTSVENDSTASEAGATLNQEVAYGKKMAAYGVKLTNDAITGGYEFDPEKVAALAATVKEKYGLDIALANDDANVVVSGTPTGAEATISIDLSALTKLKEYTVTYDVNGGTFAEGYSSTKTYTHGDMFVEAVATREGYTLDGWYLVKDDGTFDSKVTTANPVGQSFSVKAKWTANTYTIKYGKNAPAGATINGSMETDTGSFTTGNSLTLATCKYVPTGYRFLGWSEDRNATVATFADGDTITFEEVTGTPDSSDPSQVKVILWAVWEKGWTVTFDQGGHGLIDAAKQSVFVKDGESLALPGASYITVDSAYDFIGWRLNDAGDLLNGGAITPSANVTYVAQYQLKS